LEPLVRANPEVFDYRKEWILLRADLGLIPHDSTKNVEAKKLLEQCRGGLEELLEIDPGNLKLLLKTLMVDRHLTPYFLANQADRIAPQLVENSRQVLDQVQQQVIGENRGGKLRGEFSVELFQLGHYLSQGGHLEIALKSMQLGATLASRLAEEIPGNLNHHQNYQFGLSQLAHLFTLDQQYENAQTAHRKRLEALSKYAKQIPDTPEALLKKANLQFEEAKTHNALARLSLIRKQPEIALEELDKSEKLVESLIKQFPDHRAFFAQELQQSQSIRKQVLSLPAIAEKRM
ncbi:MAG: hypothetical protein KDA84_16245, partial [Planctomycetaceae bacterium]|nr:hypothetical protein [Planctomycetaceae bacterium]